MEKRRAFFGTCVDTPKCGEIRGLQEQVLILVSAFGRIASVHRGAAAEEYRETLERDGVPVRVLNEFEILVPGFIDTHIHFPQFPFTGAGIDKPLMGGDGFLTKYAFPTEESMIDVERARSVYSMALETLLSHGTTTALIFASIHSQASKELVDLTLQKQGPRAFVGKVCVDRHCPDSYIETTEDSLKSTEDFIKYTQNCAVESGNSAPYLVQAVVTPRFLPTSSPELLTGLAHLAEKYKCVIQSHMSESIDAVAFSSSLFPGKSDAEVFADFGLLREQPASVMAHCVQMTKGEEDILEAAGGSIAHCPLSNFFFAHGALPVKYLLRRGIKVGLGTDVAGGYSPSILSAMRAAVMASKSLQFRYLPGSSMADCIGREGTDADVKEAHDLDHFEALYLATLGGANALGLSSHLGSFEEGKCFDAVVLRSFGLPRNWTPSESKEDLLLKIITLGDDRNVKEVFVDGRSVYQAQA